MLALAEVRDLLSSWLDEFDRAQQCYATGHNDMHVIGAGIAQLLARHILDWDASDAELTSQQNAPELFCIRDADHTLTRISDMLPGQLTDFVMNFQILFQTMYQMTPDSFSCRVDMSALMIAVLKRLGEWLQSDVQKIPDALQQSMDPLGEDTVWHRLRPDVSVQILDGVHALLTAHKLLVCSVRVPVAETADLQQYHLEASREVFYELATIADCGVGLIVQYKHKFKELFHSPTQVVYYHYPAYQRRLQRTLDDLLKEECPAVNVLALALQIEPDIPIVHEHTGMGLASKHAQHAYSWVLIQDIVLLVDAHMQTYCGSVSDLLATIQKEQA